jgi:hypothetical protein
MIDRIHAVLARTDALAGDRGLGDARRFVAALPAGDDAAVLLLGAAGVDVDGLARWVAARAPDVPIRGGELESAGEETLAANRVLVALRCGELLQLAVVEAAASVVSRPPGTFAVVLVGAEALRGAEELDLVRRGLWRVLLGDPGVEWNGQDLAGRGCLLWSHAAVAAELADRVAGDMRLLGEWVDGGPRSPGPLAELRARHALDLAERELAGRVPPPAPAAATVDMAALRTAVADLRDRLLERLDADLRVVALQIAASLEMLEQDLLAGVDDRLGRDQLTGAALTATVSAHMNEAVGSWRAGVARLVEDRLRRSGADAVDLLDRVDWDLVNAAAGGGYPAAILRGLEPGDPVSPALPEALAGPPVPGRRGPAWLPIVRRAAYGGVAAAVGFVVLGPILLPAAAVGGAVAAGALGAAGGAAADQRFTESRDRRAAATYARAAIAATMGEFARTVRHQVRASIEPVRRGVDDEFARLDAALGAAPAAIVEAPTAGVEADAALLAGLRAELTAAIRGGA